jgi:hypothetical protein
MARLDGPAGATTINCHAALMAAAGETHHATTRRIIEAEHKPATSIGSLVYPPVQCDDLVPSGAANDNNGSRTEFGSLDPDSRIRRTRGQYGPRKHAHNYDTHRLDSPLKLSFVRVNSKMTEFVAVSRRSKGGFQLHKPTRGAPC